MIYFAKGITPILGETVIDQRYRWILRAKLSRLGRLPGEVGTRNRSEPRSRSGKGVSTHKQAGVPGNWGKGNSPLANANALLVATGPLFPGDLRCKLRRLSSFDGSQHTNGSERLSAVVESYWSQPYGRSRWRWQRSLAMSCS